MIEWISVEDKMPEENEAVIVFGMPFANMGPCFSVATIDDGEWYEVDAYFGWIEIGAFAAQGFADLSADKISHWMPLPEPPEQKP